jgi:sulfite exporter TauE/SafE
MGLLLIVVGVFGLWKMKFPGIARFSGQFSSWLKGRFLNQIQKKGILSTLLLGVLNGFLPCGLIFIALSTCLIAPTALDGLYFMLMFGVGTLPVMLGFLSFVQFLVNRFNLSFARVNTIMLITAGSLLIGRVYVSHNHQASISKNLNEVEVCR